MAVIKSTDADFAQLLQSNEKAIVKYYADWCGSCKLFSPKFRRLSENEEFNGVAFIDINAEENQEARKLAGVDNLPYIAVFKNGQLVEGRATGKEEAVVEMLNAIK